MDRLLRIGVAVYVITCLTVFAGTYAVPRGTPVETTDAIVVLAAGLNDQGQIDQVTTGRVDKGIALYQAGHAPRLHMTGGTTLDGSPSSGQQMAERAIAAGIPAEAVTFEGASRSTLQNALFSIPMLDGSEHLTLVTDGFHLPRSMASFMWAGDKTLTIVATDAEPEFGHIIREGAAIWFNAGRVGAYWVLKRMGRDEEELIPWLA